MKNSKRNKHTPTAVLKEQLPIRAVKPAGKLLLISAAYQIFSVSMSYGDTPNQPVDASLDQSSPGISSSRYTSGSLNSVEFPDSNEESNGRVQFACLGCTTGPDNVPCGGTSCSCNACQGCQSCKGCEGCTGCKSGNTSQPSTNRTTQSAGERARIAFNAGMDMISKGRYADAETYFRQSVELNPKDAAAYCNLGMALIEQNKFEAAIDALNKSIKLNSKGADAYNNLGVALHGLGRDQEAKAAYEQALRIDPNTKNARSNLERNEASLKRGNANAAFRQAYDAAAKGQHAEAERLYRKVIELNPQDAAAHNNLGLTLQSQGRLPEAKAEFEQALKINPNDKSARSSLDFLDGKMRQEKAAAQAKEDQARDVTAVPKIHNKVDSLIDAIEQARSAQMHQQQGDPNKPYDTPGEKAPGSSDLAVDLSGAGKHPELPAIPPALANHPVIKEQLQKKAAADNQREEFSRQLKVISDKIKNGEGNKGQLQVEAIAIETKITVAQSTADTAVVNIKEFIRVRGVDLTIKPAPGKAEPPPPATKDQHGSPAGKPKSQPAPGGN
jgi:tetratricopeptide (TPR) repeat protein